VARPAKKRFGQHFLEPVWVARLMRVLEAEPTDAFVEVGAGLGALTRPLAGTAARVLAFEIDRDLAAELRAGMPENVSVVEGDFLEVTPEALGQGPLRVAGNLPYNVASRILFKLGALHAAGVQLVDATVMLQREVADRLLAPPGSRDYGVLSVLVQHWAEVDRLLVLPPGAFRPAPRVHSAVVRLRFHEPRPAPQDMALFVRMVRAIFTRRRKMLANALLALRRVAEFSPADVVEAAGLDARRRPETLSLAELVRLADAVASAVL
jgi:16S rRNA (adenine1518-N6/adenine1519-N6)-dimethyltransferase